jgi:hypothetical protein
LCVLGVPSRARAAPPPRFLTRALTLAPGAGATGGYSSDLYKCTSCTTRSDCVWDKYMSSCIPVTSGAGAIAMGHGVAAYPSSCGEDTTYSYRTTTTTGNEGGGGALLILLLLCCCGLCANKN